MTVKFKSFSSGSCGNCYFVGIFEGSALEAGILIDAGVSLRRLKRELQHDGLDLDCFSAILVTHDHMDHIRSLGSFCKHLHRPVWSTPMLIERMSRRSLTGEYLGDVRNCLGEGWNEVVPGRISVKYFVVPHDATQTVGYAIRLDGYKFMLMTDAGRVTEEALHYAGEADTVVFESNYDVDMLANGPYPPDLQARIRDGHGHLSNDECAAAIREFYHPGLRNIFLCHLSEHNNTPQLARDASMAALSGHENETRLVVLPRQTPSQMFLLNI